MEGFAQTKSFFTISIELNFQSLISYLPERFLLLFPIKLFQSWLKKTIGRAYFVNSFGPFLYI